MAAYSRSYRAFCLTAILSLLLNLLSPLSIAWKPLPALAAASVVAPASSDEDIRLDRAASSPNALQPQIAAHREDVAQQPAQDPGASAAAAIRNAPIMFIENVGQFASGARFQVEGGSGPTYLTGDGQWFIGLERLQRPPVQRRTKGAREHSAPSKDELRKGVNVKASFVGANANPRLEPFNRLDTHVSYFVGNDPKQWHADVPVWGGVRYKDLYPGIDLEITGEKGQMVQRLVARPGANLNAVRLRVEGAETLEVKGNRLGVTTAIGQMTVPLLQAVKSDGSAVKPPLSAPAVSGNEIASPFVSASASALDAPQETSVLLYSTFWGGSNHDGEHAMAVDGNGQAYLAGFANPPGFPATPGAFQTTINGNVNATIVKVNSAGSGLIYATYLGGNDYDVAHGIAIDADGNAYVTGEARSQNFPTTLGAYQTSPKNFYNHKQTVFITKLNPTGTSLVYSTLLGGSSTDEGYGIALDGTGAAYVAGMAFSADFPVTPGAFQMNFVGQSTDAFVTKVNPTGSDLIYSTFLGGSKNDDGYAIAVGSDGTAVVGGRTYSTDFPGTAGAFGGGYNDGFVTKLNATGSGLIYSTFVGGNDYDEVDAVAVDGSGAAYVTGDTSSTNFTTTPGAFQPAPSGYDDTFIAKFNPDGSGPVYATYLGGNDTDWAYSIAVNASGAAYVFGNTYSTNLPVSADAYDKTYNYNGQYWWDTFIAELSPDGSALIYGTYLGGTDEDDAGGIAVDAIGAIYVAGYTFSSDWPVTEGALQQVCGSCGSTADGFVTKIASAAVLASLPDSHVLNTACPECQKGSDPRVGATSSVIGNNGAIVNKGGPINTRTGGLDYTTVDLSFPALGGQMVFQRSYSSLATNLYTSTLGYGWTHNQDTRLILPGGGALGGAASPLIASAKSVSTATATSASTATAVGGTPVLFVENLGQFDAGSRFQVRGAQGSLFLAQNAIWLTALQPSPSTGKPGATGAVSKTKDDKSTPRKGVGLKETFPGANAQPKLEPFNRLETHVSYFAGSDPNKWHADVPVWGGVRYKDLYPGIDLEITSEKGQLVQRLVARSGANLEAVRMRLEGADSLAVEAGRLKATTAVGPLSMPLLKAVTPDGSPAKRSQTAPSVKGNEVTAPFATSTALPRTALATTADGSGAMELLYSTFIGGSYEETGYAIAVDPIGAAYITGDTPSSDMPVVPGSFDTTPSANYEAYVAKLNTAGSGLDYATFLGQTLNSRGNGIAVDAVGNAYVTGETTDPNFPLTPGKTVDTTQSAHEAFVTMLDPLGTSLVYSTFLGGSADDYAYGIAVDPGGEAFVTGRTVSSDFPVTAVAYATSLGGNSDAFVAKLTRSGGGLQLAYATYLGGGDEDDGYGIAVDASGNAYITGRTYSSNFPATTGAFYTSLRGADDAFVTKLDPSGSTLVYSTFLGGTTNEEGHGIAVDGSGAAYVTGVTNSWPFPTTTGAFGTSPNGSGDAFVTKLDPTGSTLAYSTSFGGSSEDYGLSIAVDANGQAAVTGYTYSADFPLTSGAYDSSFNGQDDAFVTELNATASALVYSTYVGGSTDDRGYGLAVDGSGAIFVTGQTNSLDWPATPGAFQTYCNNCSFYSMHDSFVLKVGVRPSPPAATGHILFKPHNANQLTFDINADGTFSPYPGILASLIATTNPPGYRLTASDQSVYVFDPTGRLLTWADGEGSTWSYDYNGQGQLARIRDATGQRFLTLTYDGNGRVSTVKDPLGRTVQYGYDANGDLATYTDARSKTWAYHYDGTTHRLTEIVDPLGHTVERTEYDTQGRAVRQFDGNGAKTLEIVYNADGSRTITDGASHLTTATYDSRGTATSVQDAAGQTQKQFDGNFRPSQITDPISHTTSLTWSMDGANLTQVVDARGMTTTLSYDSLNNLTRTVDALGRTSNFIYSGRLLTRSSDALGNTTLYTYTAEGFLAAQTDARGNTTRYSYNPFGQRTAITDMLNNITRFEYDTVGRLVRTTDPLQHVTLNEYDNEDHLTKVTQNYVAGQPQNYQNQFNIVTQYGYDDAGRRVTTTDTLGRVTKNDFDAAGRLIKTTQNYDAGQPQNGGNQYNIVTQYGYDNAGYQTLITDTLGFVTRNEYNAAGRLWKTTVNYQDGAFNPAEPDRDLITTYDYDAAGNVTSKTDPLGRVTWTEYDELNRVKKVIANYVDGVYNAAEPDRDLITQTTYDQVGNVQTTTDPLGHITRTDYDRLNRPTKVTVNYVDGVYNPAEPDKDLVTLQRYDAVGNRDLVTNTLGYETQTEYDALNRTYRVTQNPLAGQPQNYQNEWNIITQYGYDELGSRVTTTDTANRVTKNDYDALNRVKSVTANYVQGAPADEQTNVTTSYSYDALGNRLTATDPLTHVTSWNYDALGRVLTETRPLANVTTYAYDPRGNRTRVTDPRNHSTLYGYDALSRNTLITDTLSQVTRYVYDAGGRRTQEIDPLSHSTTYGYDLADRQTTVTDALTHLTRYGYDGLGNRVSMTDARNVITAYWYDAANRLKGVIENYVQGGGSDQQTNVTTEYSYDGLGNRTHIHDAKGHDTNFTYDHLNRVQTEADALNHTTTYHYYPTGQRSMMVDAKNQQTLYTYDNLYRLKQTIYSTDGTNEEFAYDAVGNRKVMTDTVGVTQYSYDDLNRLRQVVDPYNQAVGYDYDAAGNRTLITYPDAKQVTYNYTALNRLEAVKDWANQWTYYGYDAASRPITATLPNGVTTSYAYDNANRLTGLSHTTGGGGVTLSDYQFGLDAVGNRTTLTETVQVPGIGGARRVLTATQILVPFLSNQSVSAQPTIESSQNPILLPFLSSGGVGPSEQRWAEPLEPTGREPGRAPTVVLPTPNKTAAPKTAAPGQGRVPTRVLVPAQTAAPQTATPTDQQRVGGVRPHAVESVRAGSTTSTTFNPVADSYVDSSNPTVNYGTETQIRVDGSPTVNSYLRFTVQGVTGPVSRVTLKVYANSAQTTGYTAKGVADNTWTETGLTYNNAPAIGSSIGSSGAVTANTWTSVDVTSYVTGNGTFSLALTTSNSTALSLASREAGANAPQLVIEMLSGTIFTPTIDSYVESANPTVNHGTETQIRVDGSPTTNSYLRFTVQGLTGTVTKATLRIYPNSSQATGYTVKSVSDNTWTETGLTYNNAPAIGSSIGSSGAVVTGTWTAVDVTSYITGNGTFNFALTTTDATALSLASRESTNPPQLVVHTAPTFTPDADSYVDSANPTVNHGTETQIRVDGSPAVNSYLRFTVQGLTGVSKATLRIYANSAQTTGYTAKGVADNTWTETGLTYNNAPAIGSSIGSSGAVTANTWTSVDVTSYVTGNGTFSLALTTSNSTALSLASREAGANAPQLVVEADMAPPPPTVETTTISYSYDPLSRLTGASYTGTLTNTFAYTYDAVGNRLTQVVDGSTTTYGYDNANRLTTVNGVTYSWDDNGNLLNDGAKTYGYDQANRLKQVVQGATTTTFAYNGVGDRLSQTVGAATTHYVLDPGAGLTQVLADGTNTYLYGNDRIGQYQTAMQYYGADGLGSARQLYDASGRVIATNRYDPYGNLMSHSGEATSVFGFTGEQWDAATGLEYLRARYYSSAQGRFLTRDVWEGNYERPLSLNAWNYANANPVNYADPSGHCLLGVDCIIIGGVVIVLGIVAISTTGCNPAQQPTPTPYPTPQETEFAGYVLIGACGLWTDCEDVQTNKFDAGYGVRPLSPIMNAFKTAGGTVSYVPGYFQGEKDNPGETRAVGMKIASMIQADEKAGAKGAFLIGHSLGGNLVTQGLEQFRRLGNNPHFVKGIVLVEPDLLDPGRPAYKDDTRYDRQDVATQLSQQYPMLVLARKDWLNLTEGKTSVPTPGSSKLETKLSGASNHLTVATYEGDVALMIDFFRRNK